MDTPQTITHVSLCAGYGGIDIGLKRAIPNLRTIAVSEIEAFACANLVAKMEAGLLDAAPIWTDLKTFPWSEFRDRVDILSGGYPCQPFSAAGKRQGADDPRHLWPYIADGIVRMQPRVCFFENVEGHISLGLPDVIEDLAGLGYRTTWGIFSASEVGATHQRKRVFVLAHCKSAGLERYDGLLSGCGEPRRNTPKQEGQAGWSNSSGDAWPSRPGQQQHAWEPPRVVVNSAVPRLETQREESVEQRRSRSIGKSSWREAESPLGGDADGPSGGMDNAELYTTCDNRTDELRLLGNGVVPATAERAFRILSEELLLTR